jgi:hypothetical protein
MNGVIRVLSLVVSLLVSACASQADKVAGGANRVAASGYTKEGCLLNLKLAAREQSARLNPDDVTLDSNVLLLMFPFLNQEAYRCTGAIVVREKRIQARDPVYPID